jgi:uncharacterized protein involved in exopolysaccharide biosynthesis
MNGFTVDLPPGEEEINLRAYWRVLVRRRALILRLVVVVTVVTACLMLLLPNIYQSTATLMPLAPARSSSLPTAMLGDLRGVLPSGGGVSSLLGKESPTDRLVAILKSRTLAMLDFGHLGNEHRQPLTWVAIDHGSFLNVGCKTRHLKISSR